MSADACPKCGGTGKCPACAGAGILVAGAHRGAGGLPRDPGPMVSRCGTCKGSGNCPLCRGVDGPAAPEGPEGTLAECTE
jgi:hypothetical protein